MNQCFLLVNFTQQRCTLDQKTDQNNSALLSERLFDFKEANHHLIQLVWHNTCFLLHIWRFVIYWRTFQIRNAWKNFFWSVFLFCASTVHPIHSRLTTADIFCPLVQHGYLQHLGEFGWSQPTLQSVNQLCLECSCWFHPRAMLPITLGDKEAQTDGILTEIQATVNISWASTQSFCQSARPQPRQSRDGLQHNWTSDRSQI